MSAIRHILVGTDFSDVSKAALEEACVLARALGARVTLLHVRPPGEQALGAAAVEEGMAMGHDVHEALSRLKDRLTGVAESKVEMLAAPSAAAAIIDYAHAHEVDLVIVGSHGYGTARRFLLGSVAERVARHASCSVLVARPPQPAGG